MENLAAKTGVNIDTAMYYTRVMTFDFATNGIGVPIFTKIKYKCVAN